MSTDCYTWPGFLRRVAVLLVPVGLVLAAAAFSGMAGCAGSKPPAPSAHAELRSHKPHPRAVWVPGRWVWSGRKEGYRWVEGHWELP